ncbi:MAG: YqgE/AlgH family protein [Bacteroidota bacterium]
MNLSTNELRNGSLLLAEPFLQGNYFSRSVVLLADYSQEGAFGIIINKPMETKVNEVLLDYPELDFPIYLGGPVQKDNVFFIHTLGDIIPESVKIIDGLFWGGDFEMVKELIKTKSLNSTNIRFFIGYAGWTSMQLEEELKINSWVISESNTEEIMGNDSAKLWKTLVKRLGDDYKDWINYPINPMLN